MFKLLSIGAVAFALSFPLSAAVTTWSFTDSNNLVTDPNDSSLSTFQVESRSITATLSGYSDTTGGRFDNLVEQGRMTSFGSSGVGMLNQDELRFGETASPDHSIDSFQQADSGNALDFDLVQLSFDRAVNLTSLQLDFAQEVTNNGSRNAAADLSVLSYDGQGINDTAGDLLNGRTWQQIADDSAFQLIDQYANVSSSVMLSSTFESKYWFVGVYNPVFQDKSAEAVFSAGGDAFKLVAATGKSQEDGDVKVDKVSAPATAAMMALFTLGLFLRRRRS